MNWTWVEPCAGAAACALRLVGGPHLVPPVSWMGGKRRLAPLIIEAMGTPRERPALVVLSDAGPWGWVWPLLLERGDEVAAILRGWEEAWVEDGDGPRALWDALRDQPPMDGPAGAAQWLWLQARSASGVPVWWGGDGFASDAGSRRAEQKGDNSRSPSSGRQKAKSANKIGVIDYEGPDRRWPGGGIVHPATIAARVQAIASAFAGVRVVVYHGDAGGLFDVVERVHDPRGPLFVYLDPPYQGCTGYGWDMPREDVLLQAAEWAALGAVVAVSEAVPLSVPVAQPLWVRGLIEEQPEAWWSINFTAHGNGKPEWLTLSREPVRAPAVQLSLLEVV